jgi:hypothetical protein
MEEEAGLETVRPESVSRRRRLRSARSSAADWQRRSRSCLPCRRRLGRPCGAPAELGDRLYRPRCSPSIPLIVYSAAAPTPTAARG